MHATFFGIFVFIFFLGEARLLFIYFLFLTTLHYTTLHYTTLHYTTLHYKTLEEVLLKPGK